MWRVLIAGMLGTMVLAPCAVRADDSKPAPSDADDSDFLEFLGSVGSEDEDWIDYLAATDPGKVASAPRSPPPSGANRSEGKRTEDE